MVRNIDDEMRLKQQPYVLSSRFVRGENRKRQGLINECKGHYMEEEGPQWANKKRDMIVVQNLHIPNENMKSIFQ